jgi:cytochrome c553
MNRNFVASLAAMLPVVSLASWAADDGAALYKKKCAGCHGEQWVRLAVTVPLKCPSRPKPPPGSTSSLQMDLRVSQSELRKKEIHVVSDAIAKLMADSPHTI